MPSHAPDSVKEPRQRMLWRDISRLYEDYCGSKESKWPERKREFQEILFLIDEKLKFGQEAIGMKP